MANPHDKQHGKSHHLLNVVTICASLRKDSYNRILMEALPELAPPEREAPAGPAAAAYMLR